MRGFLIIFAIIASVKTSCQSFGALAEFEKFKLRFPIVATPFDTRPINKDPMKIWSPTSNKLSASECVKFFFKGDITKAKYKSEKIDMMEGKSLGWVERTHNFYTVFRVEDEKLVLLGFMMSDDLSYSCYLAIFSVSDFSLVDCIQINRISENGDPARGGFIASIVDKQIIKTFKYEYIFRDSKKPLTGEEFNALHKTKITSTNFKIDHVSRRLSKSGEKIDFSNCFVDDIFFNKNNCAEKDPMNKKQ